MNDVTAASTDSYDYDADYEHDKVLHGEEAFCSGHVDAHGKWNNGFSCPSTPGVQYRCCGTGTTRHCCVLNSSNNVANTSLPFNNASLVFGITSGVGITLLLFAIILCILCKILKLYRKQARHTRELYRLHYPTPVSAVTSLFSNSQDSVGQSEHQGRNNTGAIYERSATLQSHVDNLDRPQSANQSSLIGYFPHENGANSYDSRRCMSNSASFNTDGTMLSGFSRPLPVLYECANFPGNSTDTLLPTSSSSVRTPAIGLSEIQGVTREHDRITPRRDTIPIPCRQQCSSRNISKSPNTGSENSQRLQLSANQLLALLKLSQPGSWESAVFNHSVDGSFPLGQANSHDGCSASLSHENPARHKNVVGTVTSDQTLNNLGKSSIKRPADVAMETFTSPMASTSSASASSMAISSTVIPAAVSGVDVETSSHSVATTSEPNFISHSVEAPSESNFISHSVGTTSELSFTPHTVATMAHSASESQEEVGLETIPMQLNIPNHYRQPEAVGVESVLTSSTKL